MPNNERKMSHLKEAKQYHLDVFTYSLAVDDSREIEDYRLDQQYAHDRSIAIQNDTDAMDFLAQCGLLEGEIGETAARAIASGQFFFLETMENRWAAIRAPIQQRRSEQDGDTQRMLREGFKGMDNARTGTSQYF